RSGAGGQCQGRSGIATLLESVRREDSVHQNIEALCLAGRVIDVYRRKRGESVRNKLFDHSTARRMLDLADHHGWGHCYGGLTGKVAEKRASLGRHSPKSFADEMN